MATDAQGRRLSDDGFYFWDGSGWQLVDQGAASSGSGSSPPSQKTDAQGRLLSDDGNYWWDGGRWQPVDDSGTGTGTSGTGTSSSGTGTSSSGTGSSGSGTGTSGTGSGTWPPEGYPTDIAQWTKEQVDYWFGNIQDESDSGWSTLPTQLEMVEIPHDGDAAGV